MGKNIENLTPSRFHNFYKKIFPGTEDYIKKELFDCSTVLDLGCGKNSLIQYCKVSFSVGVDLFEPYLKESKIKKIHNEYIKKDVREIEFEKGSFDAVIALDVLEHLKKKDGYKLINKMENIAKKKVILFTPNGFVEQNKVDKNPLQEHKSGWTTTDLEKLGFKVYGIHGWKNLRTSEASVKYKPTFFWERFAIITQKITYHYPKIAFHLLAVKDKI